MSKRSSQDKTGKKHSSKEHTDYVLASITQWPFKQGLKARKIKKLYDINLGQNIDPFKKLDETKKHKAHDLLESAYSYLDDNRMFKYKNNVEKLDKYLKKEKALYLPLGLYGSKEDLEHILVTLFLMQDISNLKKEIGIITVKNPMSSPERRKVEKRPLTKIAEIFDRNKDKVALFLKSSERDDSGAVIDIINGTRVCSGTKAYTISDKTEKGHRFGYPEAMEYNEDDMEDLIDKYIKYASKKSSSKVPVSRGRIGGAGSITRATSTAYVPLEIKQRIEKYNAGLEEKSRKANNIKENTSPSRTHNKKRHSHKKTTSPTRKSPSESKHHSKSRSKGGSKSRKRGKVVETIAAEVKTKHRPEKIDMSDDESGTESTAENEISAEESDENSVAETSADESDVEKSSNEDEDENLSQSDNTNSDE